MLTPLTGSKETQVKNSAEFVGRIREKKPREGEIMISFDVVSLFTKVPIQEEMQAIHSRAACKKMDLWRTEPPSQYLTSAI